MAELPNAPVKRVLLASGIERISAGAVSKAAEAAESYLTSLAKAALDSALENKRKTVMDEDIAAATEACKPAIDSANQPTSFEAESTTESVESE